MRGSPYLAGDVVSVNGSIPACAGKPQRNRRPATCPWVHPRVCGEASISWKSGAYSRGPSPRVRGSRLVHESLHRRVGSIPACAGKPGTGGEGKQLLRVHPRVCGEASFDGLMVMMLRGPSPRVRGSLQGYQPRHRKLGSIPACAGKPTSSTASAGLIGVHPRVCGEAESAKEGEKADKGPSPRVRGSRDVDVVRAVTEGSIPACAGKPGLEQRPMNSNGVHPRVCGEAAHLSLIIAGHRGPSPRVRGSLIVMS